MVRMIMLTFRMSILYILYEEGACLSVTLMIEIGQ
jgi:hypothetical protein